MAGEYYMPGVQWVFAQIKGIKGSMSSRTLNIAMVLKQRWRLRPQNTFTSVFSLMNFMRKPNANEQLKIAFKPVDWRQCRPRWWKNLPSWLRFKEWAQNNPDAVSNRRTENTQGDVPQSDDSESESESEPESGSLMEAGMSGACPPDPPNVALGESPEHPSSPQPLSTAIDTSLLTHLATSRLFRSHTGCVTSALYGNGKDTGSTPNSPINLNHQVIIQDADVKSTHPTSTSPFWM
ncbi:hypothetical protein RhiLY_12079 [Ceratobasidium sp. AG-Ba]|nr:hypothetical protein RhiLY_12079 [Ceratobasidium sp. AG-Ba]